MNEAYRYDGIFELELRRQIVSEYAALAADQILKALLTEETAELDDEPTPVSRLSQSRAAADYLRSIDDEIEIFYEDEWAVITFWATGTGMNWEPSP